MSKVKHNVHQLKEGELCGENQQENKVVSLSASSNKRIVKLLGQYKSSLIMNGFVDIAYDTINEINAVVEQLHNA